MDILDEIVAHKRQELCEQKAIVSPVELYQMVEHEISEGNRRMLSMRESLLRSSSGIIAEFKRKSPSKGWIHEDAQVEDVTRQYVCGGASALSILTDNRYFGGDMRFIRRVRQCTDIPILRKDFIIDEYQLFQARLIGADAVLLIAADLSADALSSLARTAHQLGLETLLEVHRESELGYITDDIDMIGVNNRNLGTFTVDVENSIRMSSVLPSHLPWVSESGIDSAETVAVLRRLGYRGFLIGEAFMRTKEPGQALQEFISKLDVL